MITNFSNQMVSLITMKARLVRDEAPQSAIGRATLLTLASAVSFSIMTSTAGPIFLSPTAHRPEIQKVQANVKYAMPPHLFRNLGKGKFEEVTTSMGAGFIAPRVGRGAAYADINNDGRPDLLLATNGGPVYLFRNETQSGASANRSLRIKLVGAKSNRDGIGAVVRLTASGETQTQMLRSGFQLSVVQRTYLTFGWPNTIKLTPSKFAGPAAKVDHLSNVAAGKTITATEGKGETASRPYAK